MKIVLHSILNKNSYVYDYKAFLKGLFKEDETDNDLTTRFTAKNNKIVIAKIIAKESGVLAGIEILKDIFHLRDKGIMIKMHFKDGDEIKDKEVICTLKGRTTSILQSERIALNVLQRLSGVATEAHKLCTLIKGTKVRLLNTRKTLPGMRYLEKWATTVGGAVNHRLNLADGILIKENHIIAAGSITKAVMSVYKQKPKNILIEIEVKDLDELREALRLPVDLIMLDNFNLHNIRKAVQITDGLKPLEVSGNVSHHTIKDIAEAGVDYISVGKITHSARALDFSLLIYDEFYD